MDLNTITVADFKAQFTRDFPYLPTYNNAKLYNKDAVVYYPATELFYVCKANGTTGILPTVTASWDIQAPQDDVNDYILDSDIQKAFLEAQITFNQAFFSTDPNIQLGYLYLTAHYLVNDIGTASNGLGSGGSFPVSSRSVGNVSESYSVPQAYLDDPNLIFYTRSGYGLKYLNMIYSKLIGNFGVVCGRTQP